MKRKETGHEENKRRKRKTQMDDVVCHDDETNGATTIG